MTNSVVRDPGLRAFILTENCHEQRASVHRNGCLLMSNRWGSVTSGRSEQHCASRSSQDLQLCLRWGGDAPGTGHPSGPHRDLLQQVLAMLFVTEGSLACPLAKNEVSVACFNSSVSLMLLFFLKRRHGSDTSNQPPW